MDAWVGWVSSAILLLTLIAQVVKQWRAPSVEGVSPWLFFGQISASFGFVIYSVLVWNTVFIITNVMILLTSIIGECIFLYRHNQD